MPMITSKNRFEALSSLFIHSRQKSFELEMTKQVDQTYDTFHVKV